MKKILITGGKGFVAKNLFEKLENFYNIESLDIDKLNLLDSKKVFDYIKKEKFDVIVHTATHPEKRDPSRVLENNLKMFFNITKCKDYFGKMIYFGSGAEFGRENWKPKMSEDFFDKNIPQDQYGFSKYIMTKYAKPAKNIYNLRLFGVFGKYDNWKAKPISNFCCYAVKGLPIKVNENRAYDFLSAEDLARVVKWFCDHKPKEKVYNVCTGKIISFVDVAKKINEISGKNLKINIINSAPGPKYGGTNYLLLKEMQNFKFTPFEKKLEELYNWYDENKDIINEKEL